MALSYSSVEKAYKVFHILKTEFLENLRIPSWPDDMALWEEDEQNNPRLLIVHGWGKKYDDGWESIAFFIENPSEELKTRFEELKKQVPNSALNKAYHRNNNIWVIGWF